MPAVWVVHAVAAGGISARSATPALQSPVVIAELDHHCGVFLDFSTPKSFLVHTVPATPHGNDYGRAWSASGRSARDGALTPPP